MANETPNRLSAGGSFKPVAGGGLPAGLIAAKGVRSFTRLDAGQYVLELAQPLAFGEGYAEGAVPPNFQGVAGAQIIPGGAAVLLTCLSLTNGMPVDPPIIMCNVWAANEGQGESPELALPAIPAPIPGGAGVGGLLLFGANSVSATTADRFLYPSYDDSLAMTSAILLPVPRAGTIRNLFVSQTSGAGNGEDIVYEVRVNGAPTGITVTLASTLAGTVSDLVNAVVVAQGDRVDLIVTKALSVGTGPSDITATMELAA